MKRPSYRFPMLEWLTVWNGIKNGSEKESVILDQGAETDRKRKSFATITVTS